MPQAPRSPVTEPVITHSCVPPSRKPGVLKYLVAGPVTPPGWKISQGTQVGSLPFRTDLQVGTPLTSTTSKAFWIREREASLTYSSDRMVLAYCPETS